MSTAHCNSTVDQIGDAAGQIWHYLNEHGPTAVTRLIKDVDVPRDLVMQGIGWLAREDKVTIDNDSRSKTVSLH